uniref:BPTI/Kunitz inhibitor domain-containing protein n=1 Tax=Laticauda laticaudata TaxID=8630 RepID=A0A8C5SA07_LATLA
QGSSPFVLCTAGASACLRGNICTLPPDRGPCKEKLQRWFYELKTDRCKKFTFGGCEGNANNFNVRWMCRRRCPLHPAAL